MRLRMYQPAWNKLKSNPDNPLVISAVPEVHARIYKAIVKEKNLDDVFHTQLGFDNKTSRLSKRSEGNALIVTLTISPSIEGLF